MDLMDKHGLEGYAFVVLIVEKIAQSMEPGDDSCELTYTFKGWARALGISTLKTKNMMTSLHQLSNNRARTGEVLAGLCVCLSGHTAQVHFPNLLTAKDDYSRKSGHTEPLSPPRLEETRLDKTRAKPNPDEEQQSCQLPGQKKSGGNGSIPVCLGEPVAVADVKLRVVDDDSWAAWSLPTKANSFEAEPKHGYWCKMDSRLRNHTGSHDWFSDRLDEARARTTGKWMHKYSGPIDGNAAAWLTSQCQDRLKGVWK